jgi:hypothetical protein
MINNTETELHTKMNICIYHIVPAPQVAPVVLI